MKLNELLEKQPFLPYIRESDYAVRSPWHMPERRLLDYLIIYFQEGHCLLEIDSNEYHFYADDFALVQPGSLINMYGLTDTITPFAHLDIFYNLKRVDSFPTRAGQIDLRDYLHLMQPCLNDTEGIHVPIRLSPKDPEQLRTTLLRMIECWRSPHPLQQMEAQAHATQMIVQIINDHTKIRLQVNHQMPAFSWFPSYLSLHLSEQISVEDMAQRTNLSISRFREVFKQKFGMPPHQYLLHLRVRHAKELLLNTDYSIERIAEYCGFANIHHFSKSFKRLEHRSPTDFRKQKT